MKWNYLFHYHHGYLSSWHHYIKLFVFQSAFQAFDLFAFPYHSSIIAGRFVWLMCVKAANEVFKGFTFSRHKHETETAHALFKVN